ncbi:zinc finger protein 37-like [Ischnura elegans]|uniref:zinc finger protein 37-like n=1 Tax=Ischnura elegans TaxID=197161 RepID=UPI001ED8B219|nr:zinc finger protein 37-like [Ischnura elegans]
MQHTSDPAGISTDVSDPLATDELSDPVTYKCSSVKNDEISDDEEGYVFNDCSDGTSSKQLHQDSSDQSIGGEGAVHDNLRSSTETKDCVPDAIVSTLEKACSVQRNEIFIPVQDIQLPTANMLCHVLLENKESQREENNQMLHGTTPDGIESDAIDPLAMDDLFHVKEENIDPLKEENEVLHGTAPDGIERDAIDPLAIDDLPTSTENGQLIQNQAMAMDSMTKAVDLPASERASASFALLEPKNTASNLKKERKVMGKDIEKCGAHLSDKITSCSIPDDGQLHSKSKHVSKIIGNRATMTLAGETSSCDNPNSIKFFRVTDSRKTSNEAVMRENKEMSTSMIKNPGKRAISNDNSNRCFDCGDAFNAENDLIKHLKIHFGSSNVDIHANLTIGNDLALKTLGSGGETNCSHRPTSSKSLNKLICKRKGMRQNGNGLFKANFGGTREKKKVREVRKSFTVDGTSCTDSSHSAKKPYSCNECEQSFSNKHCLVRHVRTHTKEKPYSCIECEKSFSKKSNLVQHIRTHTKEKPYSCGECEKSFSRKSHLVNHPPENATSGNPASGNPAPGKPAPNPAIRGEQDVYRTTAEEYLLLGY